MHLCQHARGNNQNPMSQRRHASPSPLMPKTTNICSVWPKSNAYPPLGLCVMRSENIWTLTSLCSRGPSIIATLFQFNYEAHVSQLVRRRGRPLFGTRKGGVSDHL